MGETEISAQKYLDLIEAENLALDQELQRLNVPVPVTHQSSDSLHYSSDTPSPVRKKDLVMHKCRSSAELPRAKEEKSQSLRRRVQGMQAAAANLAERAREQDSRLSILEAALSEKQASIDHFQTQHQPELYRPSAAATSSLTLMSRKKQLALEQYFFLRKLKTQTQVLIEERKTMARFQRLNHDLLYRAREKLQEETQVGFAEKSDGEVRAKIKEMMRDGEMIKTENEKLREEIQSVETDLADVRDKRTALETEIRKFEYSTRALYAANQVLRENLIKLVEL